MKQRSNVEKRMYKKIGQFGITKKTLFDPYLRKNTQRLLIDNKILLPYQEIDPCIEYFYMSSKGDGAKKLYHAMKESYFGIGERLIQNYVNRNKLQRLKRPKFSNKAPLKPVTSSSPMNRHQIDLVDMRSLVVNKNGEQYSYILSVIDVFSRFLWLRPLQDKTAQKVCNKITEIYSEFGQPKSVQCDQGSEFKGEFENLCRDLNILIIRSSSHHPQSQGKIERSHSSWKSKIRFDIIRSAEEENTDWMSNLPKFQQIYNEAMHTSLNMSPYQCLFGVVPNRNKLNHADGNDRINQNVTDVQRRTDSVEIIRRQALNKNNEQSSKMTKQHLAKNPPSMYELGEKVYLKYTGKDSRVKRGGASLKLPKVLEGTVVETNKVLHKYKIKYTEPGRKESTVSWIHVDKITAKDYITEQSKKADAERHMNAKTSRTPTTCRKQLNFSPLQELNFIIAESKIKADSYKDVLQDKIDDLAIHAAEFDLIVDENVPSDGNCMFHALCMQLKRLGMGISHRKLRKMVIQYLRKNPIVQTNSGEVDFRDFHDNWDGYLSTMEQEGEWGDNTILVATACLFRVPIRVFSSLANSRPIDIVPGIIARDEVLYLGHLAEFHYVNLLSNIQNNFENETIDQMLCQICGSFYSPSQDFLSHCETCVDDDSDTEISIGKPHLGPNDLSQTPPLNSPTPYTAVKVEGKVDTLQSEGQEENKGNNLKSMPKDPDTIHEKEIGNSLMPEVIENIDTKLAVLKQWLEDRLASVYEHTFGKGFLLAKDQRSMLFYHFLKDRNVILQLKRNHMGDFILINNDYMDIYDDMRSLILTLFKGMVLIYITKDVLKWIKKSGIDTEYQSIFENRIMIIDAGLNDELVSFLEQNENGENSSGKTD